ncbi:ManA, mannose-6-phosphate isomerase [Stappia aggregata IAM 12614]|uniref:ManA, mannose-6-phosphate isomerase n=1 Tax=Roseibium aggregatum (strain ATCC 25650 / DSM 13394 / JCM 20685 / NBRC 16684 / NCIMB 2208 / IAM 12614 / B1) TaxID=384765 RepID=A0NU11_ROSAI|nr:AGE family epimerase/isomerase [Roseibium aggregatum]EAV43920.1 ManA, mannose-6-phosphate isomerase [Stappia aggregata IAM 12614] [Roseibium aggregatum IAM 12614]
MTASNRHDDIQNIKKLSSELTIWLRDSALPLWSTAGLDQQTNTTLDVIDPKSLAGLPVPRRARVVNRQIYSFLEGRKLGWTGPAEETATALFDWYTNTFLMPEGHYAACVDIDNKVTDPSFDLYNQSFSLFGFSQIAANVPACTESATEHADNLLRHLMTTYRHPEAGFQEASPSQVPLCSNPHMHMFEACLAWETVSENAGWADLADEIAELALTRFIDPVSGGLREFFNGDWTPFDGDKGRVMEPGHQFEWAWLLARWGQSRKDAGALIAARRLYDIAWTYGIDESRGVAFMALNDDFSVRDPMARLWGQTEWIKAAIALAEVSTGTERDAYLADIPEAVQALQIYFAGVPAGLWRDKLAPDGTFTDEAAPASSLYHIVCAIAELHNFSETL